MGDSGWERVENKVYQGEATNGPRRGGERAPAGSSRGL